MLVSVGVSHKRVSLPTLDALTLRDQPAFYNSIDAIQEVHEVVVLQTCNRVEIIAETEKDPPIESILRNWALTTRFRLTELQKIAEAKTDEKVIDHLVRLASGLESMIVGEPQILGQMKSAIMSAKKHRTGLCILPEVFDRATAAGAKIRTETGIGRGTTTIGSAALRLAEQNLGRLDELHVLVIGTGHVGALVMKALKARGVQNVIVAGRSREKTEAFCRSFGGTAITSQTIPKRLENSDLVLVATRSNNFIIEKARLEQHTKQSRKRLLILDLSNPRNVSPKVSELENVTLRTIDDLRSIAEEGLASRRELVKRAEPLVRDAVHRISAGLRREKAEPIISDVYHRAEEIRLDELNKAFAKLNLTPEQEQVLEHTSQRIVDKVLNGPAMKLRLAAEKGDSRILAAAGQLFAGE